MSMHPAIVAGRVAVVTGGASGIGLAAAERFGAAGMRVALADIDAAALSEAEARLRAAGVEAAAVPTDVGDRDAMAALKAAAEDLGEIAIVMNNAAREGGGGMFADVATWRKTIETNLWGVVNGVQVFAPAMIDCDWPCAIINTGSKQGITLPPGDAAYNVSKAGVKAVTELLANELLRTQGRVSAHLLIPGFTFTGFTRAKGVSEKPDAAWLSEQVADFLLTSMAAGDFYILCPDNDVPRELDEKRIAWAAGDIIENRPALSRWHPDYTEAFRKFVSGG